MVATAIRLCAATLVCVLWPIEYTSAGMARVCRRQTVESQTVTDPWPRVALPDPHAASALRNALETASQWLSRPKCQTLFTDFQDERGRPLIERLAIIGISADVYLGWIFFRDGSEAQRCATALAYTEPGSRVVRVCSLAVERAGRQNADYLVAIVIHEMLHTLGLGENPPSSSEITARVRQRCWNRGK